RRQARWPRPHRPRRRRRPPPRGGRAIRPRLSAAPAQLARFRASSSPARSPLWERALRATSAPPRRQRQSRARRAPTAPGRLPSAAKLGTTLALPAQETADRGVAMHPVLRGLLAALLASMVLAALFWANAAWGPLRELDPAALVGRVLGEGRGTGVAVLWAFGVFGVGMAMAVLADPEPARPPWEPALTLSASG